MTRFVTKTTLCSTLAIATAMVMAPQRAAAQSLVGSVNYTSPNVVSVNQSVANQTTVTLNAGQSVINWGATNAAVAGVRTFQPNGTTATFTGASDFAVLNRVGAGFDAIKLDGTINSLVNGQVGGTVYFQSNNGIVIGQNAVINVGSLGLTTLDRDDDGFGNWMDNFGTSSPSVTFNTAINPNSHITVEAGAQLNANGGGNYVALVAPKITHSGIIRTDGGAALVAAEAATVTFSNSNLYTIEVTSGTTESDPLRVQGGTIARNSQALGGGKHAFLVAVPKNQATTMVITGGASLGFEIATAAQEVGNSIILMSGTDSDGFSPGATGAGNIAIEGATINSNLDSSATNFNFIDTLNGAVTINANVAMRGENVRLSA